MKLKKKHELKKIKKKIFVQNETRTFQEEFPE
jgi:hypothetical protein